MMKKLIDGLFSRDNIRVFVLAVIKFRYALLIAACVITAGSIWLDLKIGLNSSIMALLPKNTPSIKRVKELEKKIGGQGDLIVMVESSDKKKNIDYAEKILPEIRKLSWVDRAGYKLNDTVFDKNKLLFLDTNDLKELRNRIERYMEYKKKSANPFLVDLLGEDEPASLDISDIEKKYAGAGGSLKANISEDGTMLLVAIHPHGMTSNISFAKRVYIDVKSVVGRFEKDAAADRITVSVGGTYRNRLDEYETVIRDLKSGTLLGIVAILVLIILYFRRISLMLCILIPLAMSETWTFAITQLVIGELNLITAFLIIIVFGLGIDFGIHLLNRYMIERRSGKDHFDSLVIALQKSSRASLTSALTIIASFYMLMFSNFLGFRHFGFIAGTGILLAYLAYMVICPALLTVFNDMTHGLMISSKKQKNDDATIHSLSADSLGYRPAILAGVVLTVITIISVWQLSKVAFEYDFRNLRSQIPSTREFNKKVSRVFKTARDPAALLIRNEQDASDIEKYLHDNKLLGEKSPVEDCKSICSVIPRDQKKKLEIFREIKALIDENKPFVGAKKRKYIDEMSSLLVDAPLTIDDIPTEISSLFLGLPGTPGQVMYLYQRYSLLDLHKAENFSKAVGALTVNRKQYHAISEPLVYLDVVNLLKKDSIIAIIGALIIIVAVIFLDFGNIRGTIMVLIPLFVGLVWMFGLMGLFSLKLNIFNMVILPSILGLGIDAAIQVYHHLQEEWGMPFGKLLVRIGGPNILCTAINLIGFGGIVTANHSGLRTIGQLAIIGMSTCLVAALSILPVMMAFNKKRPTA